MLRKISLLLVRRITARWRAAMCLFATVLLYGCAAAPGPHFSGVRSPVVGKGDVYLYRGRALFASATSFSVAVDGQSVGDLHNGSFLVLRLPPGNHSLAVSPGGLARTSHLQVRVNPGESQFFEFDFVTGPLANAFFAGSSIQPRARDTAIAHLKELKEAALATVDLHTRGAFAQIDDASAVPYLNERGRDGFKDWLQKPKPRAFVLTRAGTWFASWGANPKDPTDPKDPAQRALRNCRTKGFVDCKLYAVDDRVVWQLD